jgi:hypothetical protein
MRQTFSSGSLGETCALARAAAAAAAARAAAASACGFCANAAGPTRVAAARQLRGAHPDLSHPTLLPATGEPARASFMLTIPGDGTGAGSVKSRRGWLGGLAVRPKSAFPRVPRRPERRPTMCAPWARAAARARRWRSPVRKAAPASSARDGPAPPSHSPLSESDSKRVPWALVMPSQCQEMPSEAGSPCRRCQWRKAA